MYKNIHLQIPCNTGSCSTLTDAPWGWYVGAISVWTTSGPALNQLWVESFFFPMLCFACLLLPLRRPLAFLNKFIFIIQVPFNTEATQAWKMWRDNRDTVLRTFQSSSCCCITFSLSLSLMCTLTAISQKCVSLWLMSPASLWSGPVLSQCCTGLRLFMFTSVQLANNNYPGFHFINRVI